MGSSFSRGALQPSWRHLAYAKWLAWDDMYPTEQSWQKV